MLQAGSTAISQQVAEIGIGIRNKFDLTSIATAILSSGMTANLPTSNVMLRSRVGTLLACTINPMLQKGKVNVELIAAQALGALAGQEAAVGLAGAIETGWRNLTRYRQAQQAARGVGGVSQSDGMQRYEDDETQGMRPKPKSVYKAEPSKKEWAEIQFEGWEGDQQRWLSAQVSEDLKPPEIHWADGGRPPTDEEQVASYQRRQQLQAKPSSLITYGKLAETFRINAENALFAPFKEVGSIFQNPMKAVQYLEALAVVVRHPRVAAKVISSAVINDVEQTYSVITQGSSESRAALLGNVVGSVALGGFAKALGIVGVINYKKTELLLNESTSLDTVVATQTNHSIATLNLLESPRANLLRSIEDKKLQNLASRMYRENATIGSGSTADIIRYELETGELYSPSGHMQKGIEMRSALSKLIESNTLNRNDLKIAFWLKKDLQDALSQKRLFNSINIRP